ncbi:hydrolase [Corynebacterium suranareeae]|uniref:Hydrolase n=1 Tax=Corynebacterium suranareeae TaxID=2506452 RepID=A0A160PT67_9CORY|nr:polyhydroxybutyrate depolymerase [Corynebacterium suranareeae]BAU96966.1 hydrolase [Corynebacterium suranareeae]
MIQGHLFHQDRQRTFRIVEPLGSPTDALIFFHGSQQSGSVVRTFTNKTFDALPYLVVYPDGVDQHWNDARLGLDENTRHLGIDDVGFFIKLAIYLGNNFGIKRVFVAGYSNGGQMVLRLMHEVPKMLSGAATIASNMPVPDNTLSEVKTFKTFPVPYFSMAGTADPFSPYEGGDAGIGKAHRRGHGMSAYESAKYIAKRNGLTTHSHVVVDYVVSIDSWAGKNPVEFWTLNGIGHVVPSGKNYPEFLGPSTTTVIAAEEIGKFFDGVRRR